jgi:thioester reductase-like protein
MHVCSPLSLPTSTSFPNLQDLSPSSRKGSNAGTLSPVRPKSGGPLVLENSKMPDASAIHGGYAQTKWVAEQIIRSANTLGVPTSIHRPGRITGDSRTGVANLEDMLFLVLKGCIQIECYPDIVWNIDMAPVDWVSEVITTICSSSNSASYNGKAFHIMSKSFVPLAELFEWFVTRGFSLKKLPYQDWRNVLMADRDAAMQNAVYSLLPLLDEASESADIVTPKVDSSNVDSAMASAGVRCPDITHELLETYLQYFIKSGFLHAQQSAKLTAVRVGSYEISGSRFDRHVNFIIQVNFGTTSWKVKKRYRDFAKLDAELSKEFESKG